MKQHWKVRKLPALLLFVVSPAVLLTVACSQKAFRFQGHAFALDSIGTTSIDTSKTFSMDGNGVSHLGACRDQQALSADETSGISASTRDVLVRNGYCHWFVPEYHDDQKLRTNDGTSYGPLAHTFAAPVTGNFQSHAAFDQYWVNVALVIVDAPKGTVLPREYRDLNLVAGSNCLFLRHDDSPPSPNPPVWHAVMIPGDLASCATPTSNSPSPKEVVTVSEAGSTHPGDYPAASRFTEANNGGTYLGVRCGNAWCMVGAGRRSSIPAPSYTGAPEVTATKNWQIKGWFDDQHLAVPSATQPGVLVPGPAASAVPVENLAKLTLADYERDWQLVAMVVLPKQMTGEYAGSTKTRGYRLHGGTNKLWLHAVPGPTGRPTWSAQFGDAPKLSGANTYAVKMTEHPGYFIPGTVRWRWSDTDEQLWVACLMGCCMVMPD